MNAPGGSQRKQGRTPAKVRAVRKKSSPRPVWRLEAASRPSWSSGEETLLGSDSDGLDERPCLEGRRCGGSDDERLAFEAWKRCRRWEEQQHKEPQCGRTQEQQRIPLAPAVGLFDCLKLLAVTLILAFCQPILQSLVEKPCKICSKSTDMSTPSSSSLTPDTSKNPSQQFAGSPMSQRFLAVPIPPLVHQELLSSPGPMCRSSCSVLRISATIISSRFQTALPAFRVTVRKSTMGRLGRWWSHSRGRGTGTWS